MLRTPTEYKNAAGDCDVNGTVDIVDVIDVVIDFLGLGKCGS